MEKAIQIVTSKTALALEGGGALGIAEIGALSRWIELGGELTQITHICGSSIGSIISSAIAAGADIEFMKKILFGLDLKHFEDNSIGILRDIVRLVRKFGWNKGEAITKWFEDLMCKLTGNANITFEENYMATGIHLTITGCSLRYMDTIYIDHTSEPTTRLADGIRISSGIPLFYEAIFRETEEDDETVIDYLVDGGTMDNYPIHILREQGVPEEKIMGLKLCSPIEFTEYNDMKKGKRTDYGKITSIKDYIVRIINMLRNNAMKVHVHKDDWKLTVKINCGNFKSTQFDMTDEQKQWLYDQGRAAMDAYVVEVAEVP